MWAPSLTDGLAVPAEASLLPLCPELTRADSYDLVTGVVTRDRVGGGRIGD